MAYFIGFSLNHLNIELQECSIDIKIYSHTFKMYESRTLLCQLVAIEMYSIN